MKVYLLVHIHKKFEAYRILLYSNFTVHFAKIMINVYIRVCIASLIFVYEDNKICEIDIEKFTVLCHQTYYANSHISIHMYQTL